MDAGRTRPKSPEARSATGFVPPTLLHASLMQVCDQATNVGRRFRPLGTAGAKMWSDDMGLGANGPTRLCMFGRVCARARRRPPPR